jgi:hypothetical protein
LSRIRRCLGALRRLRGREEAVRLAGVCAVAPWVPLLMRLSLPRQARVLARVAARRPGAGAGRVGPERTAELVDAAQSCLHPVVRRGCLTRGVTLFWLLRRDGLDVELCFGVGGAADGFYGHCWLEAAGTPILEETDPRGRFEHHRLPVALAA